MLCVTMEQRMSLCAASLTCCREGGREERGAGAAAFAAAHFQRSEACMRNVYLGQRLSDADGSGRSTLRPVASSRAVHKL